MNKKKIEKKNILIFGWSLDFTKIRILLFVFAVLLYGNTINHDYAIDDAIVIYDNMFVQEGVSGIPGLLSKDTFFGFFKTEGKAKLVSGGRYRPLTPVMFALEWQIFGHNPMIGHLFNILLFGLLVIILFNTIYKLLNNSEYATNAGWIAFITALLFTAHPIHTECVANIKGRDEIMALLFSLSALYYSLKTYDTQHKKYMVFAAILFFFGLMSKENTITYLAIIPLALILFRGVKITTSLKYVAPLLISTITFLAIRTSVLGFDFGGAPLELMNNPFLKIVDNTYVPFSLSEKMATIVFTLGKYISILFFPHPLTHDYYPRHIELMSWSDISVILSVVLYVILGFVALKYFTKNKIVSFSILYFVITLSIVSNIVFPVGTNMGERFMFMPSLGFCFAIASVVAQFNKKPWVQYLLFIAIGLFCIKTVTRNLVWKDDFTLFTTDVKTSKKSAKLLNAAGGALSTEALNEKDSAKRTKMLEDANGYLSEAIKIHPNYKNAHLILGNVNYYLKNYEKSVQYYQNALAIDPNYQEAQKNMGVALRDAGRFYGEEKQELNTAIGYLKRSYAINPKDYETNRLMGICYGILGDHNSAIQFFREAAVILPNEVQSYVNLGTAYQNAGNQELANENYQKALQIDPTSLNHLRQ